MKNGSKGGDSGGISATSSPPRCGLKDTRRQTRLQHVGRKSGSMGSRLFSEKHAQMTVSNRQLFPDGGDLASFVVDPNLEVQQA